MAEPAAESSAYLPGSPIPASVFRVPLRQTINARQPVIGVLAPQADAALAEMIGLLGFDFYMLDAEHGVASPRDAAAVIVACERRGITALARIGTKDPKAILQYMDVGLGGVMQPSITTAEEVRQLVSAVKYPPVGRRGLGPNRASGFMLSGQSQAEYVEAANRETLVIPQVEHIDCLNHLDEILAVEGVDGFVVGPADLSMSMGFTDGPNHPEVQQVLDETYARVAASGKVLGTVASTGAEARALVDRGIGLVLVTLKALLQPSARAMLAGFRGGEE
ncbi:MAG: 4-hydroxy-2-oxoheptanedioate aldolase [Rubricoccaceae bacterium]